MRVCPQVIPSSLTYDWYKNATVRYDDYYLRMYIAFNAWYQQAAHSTNDRVAIEYLKTRSDMWRHYLGHRAFHYSLTPYIMQLVELSHREPLPTKKTYWDGRITDRSDWPSILEFWYHIRCVVVHGESVDDEYLFYAYHTLNIFLGVVLIRPSWLCDLPSLHSDSAGSSL